VALQQAAEGGKWLRATSSPKSIRWARESESQKTTADLSTHQQWNQKGGWKNVLNNLRLMIQPMIILWLIAAWLDVFPDRYLLLGFHKLIQNINQSQSYFPNG
jgi:hypothetical protein